MATKSLKGVHKYAEFSSESIRKRIQKMLEFKKDVDIEKEHVRFTYENRKTGALVPSVSLIPIHDCGPECKVCAKGCYDIRNVCYLPAVQKARAINSAIYDADPDKFFREIEERVKTLRFFRFFGGADIKNAPFLENMVRIAKITPTCEFLCFTKRYSLVNHYISVYGGVPSNLHIIFSDWRGAEFENPFNLPISSPVWKNGERGPHCTDKVTTCPGDCSSCAETNGGCWGLQKGETVLFEAH